MVRLILNPDTNALTTTAMTAIAREAAAPGIAVEGMTVSSGPPPIVDALALAGAELRCGRDELQLFHPGPLHRFRAPRAIRPGGTTRHQLGVLHRS